MIKLSTGEWCAFELGAQERFTEREVNDMMKGFPGGSGTSNKHVKKVGLVVAGEKMPTNSLHINYVFEKWCRPHSTLANACITGWWHRQNCRSLFVPQTKISHIRSEQTSPSPAGNRAWNCPPTEEGVNCLQSNFCLRECRKVSSGKINDNQLEQQQQSAGTPFDWWFRWIMIHYGDGGTRTSLQS